MNEKLTDKSFWLNYWETKKDLIQKIPVNNTFTQVFDKIIGKDSTKSAIELGGFPGHFCIYLKKRFGLEVSLFDFVIHREILKDLLRVNDLNKEDVQTMEGDIMTYKPINRFDLVFSLGLIEHFNDSKKIIEKHLEFLNPGGTLFISLPNFRGLNGWIQKKFDQENYSKHNIGCMDIAYLKKVCSALPMEEVDVRYYKSFSIWLEDPEKKNGFVKMLVKALWLTGIVIFKILPIKTRFFSPYIIITAKKPKK